MTGRTHGASRAVVVGASIAGLVAARVLSEELDEVVVVERDRLDGDDAARPGVPQANHLHVLLRRGYRELSRLYPTLDGRLAAAGAPVFDMLRDGVWISPTGEAPRFPSRLRSRSATRALIESTIRDLTFQRSNIRLLDGHEMTGLMGDTTTVRGVRLRRRPPRGAAAPSQRAADDTQGQSTDELELGAWLVVDAAGRSSQAPAHLAVIGAPIPDETVIDASLRYTTRYYRLEHDPSRDWRALLIRDRPPSSTRAGVAMEVEGDRWVVTLSGAGADQPPTDEAGFLDFARDLISPRLFHAIRDAEPRSTVRGWARTANRWRHVERIRWPDGFAVMGDALCALNPVYGQGMSVAAMEGAVLASWLGSPSVQRVLRRGSAPDTGRLVRSLAHAARLPWFLATSEDARIPGVTGAPAPGLRDAIGRRYVDAVLAQAVHDPLTLRRFLEVTNLVRPPFALLDPLVLSRIVARGIREGASITR
jgi:2-polyprenyl-6-methoxyphenol hydroxylase-like FAD-dependent oxidoreductase